MIGALPLPTVFAGLLNDRRSEQLIARLIIIFSPLTVVKARDFLQDEAIFPASIWLQLVEEPLDGAFGLF